MNEKQEIGIGCSCFSLPFAPLTEPGGGGWSLGDGGWGPGGMGAIASLV